MVREEAGPQVVMGRAGLVFYFNCDERPLGSKENVGRIRQAPCDSDVRGWPEASKGGHKE